MAVWNIIVGVLGILIVLFVLVSVRPAASSIWVVSVVFTPIRSLLFIFFFYYFHQIDWTATVLSISRKYLCMCAAS